MAKKYTDLCAFKRFLKSRGILHNYKLELKKQHPNVRDPWRRYVAIPSKTKPTGLYNIINNSLTWVNVTTIDQCDVLCDAWDSYWLKTCGPKYLKQYGSVIPPHFRQLIIHNVHV